jgi:hypothetical protein
MAPELAEAVYTCVYIEPHRILEAYKVLLKEYRIPPIPEGLKNVCCNHMTIKFKPTKDDVRRLPMGGAVDLRITGVASDPSCTVLRVEQIYGCPVPPDSSIPHITMWTDGVAPYYSNELLSRGVLEVEEGPVVSGTVGYCTGDDFKFDYRHSVYVLPAR